MPLVIHRADADSYYLFIRTTDPQLRIRPILKSRAMNMDQWAKLPAVLAVINGGFFTGNQPLSLLADQGAILARNAPSVTRGGISYPVMRSAFWVDPQGQPRIGWLYHHAGEPLPRRYLAPLPYSNGAVSPLTPPAVEGGIPISIDWGVGGGPRLLKNGQPHLTYHEEIFWGSGLRLDDSRPRTAICITGDEHIGLYVTESARLDELPARLLQLGCTDAINLDGGGSSAIYANGEKIFDQGRAVPAVLAIVHRSIDRQAETNR